MKDRINTIHTSIDLIEFTDDVQSNFGELVFQQMQEQLEEVLNSGIFAEQRPQATDLLSHFSTDMLGGVLAEVAHAKHYTRQNYFFLKELGKS